MIKESRRGIASLLVMIDWTGTYIITYKGPVIIYHLGAGGGGVGGFWAKHDEIYPIPPLNVILLK